MKGTASAPQLVIFDCDGVLVDSERLSHQVLVDMLAELRTLTPRPGAAFAGDAAPAITP